jgi:hypothetical protein
LLPLSKQAVSGSEIRRVSARARVLAVMIDIPQLHLASGWPDGWSGGNALGLAAATCGTAQCFARDTRSLSGNPAIPVLCSRGPEALRPRLATGLPLTN